MSHTSRDTTRQPGPNAAGVRTRATAAAATFVVACAVAAPSAAFAADPTPSPSVSETTSTAQPALTASFASAGMLRTGEALRASIDVTNPSGTALIAGSVQIAVGTALLTDAAALAAWIDGTAAAGSTTPLPVSEVNAIDPGGSLSTTVTTPATDPVLAALAPGSHPVTLTYTSGTTSLTERLVLTVRAADAAPVQTALVVPVTTGPSSDGVLPAETLQELTGPDGDLTELLDGLRAAPQALLAVDPALLTSIRVLGSAAPPSSRDWLRDLEALPNERFALQYADADVTAQVAAGLPAPLAPTSFDWALTPANFAETATEATPSPAPSVSATVEPTAGGELTLPDLAQITEVDADLEAWWPADGATTGQTLTAAGEAAVLLSSAHTGSAVGHVTSGGASVLAYDAGLAEVLSDAASERDAHARDDLLAQAGALVQFQSTASGGRPLFLALERGTSWDADALGETLAALSVGGVAQSITATDLLRTEATAASIASVEPDQERVQAVTGMLADEQRLIPFSTVLSDPQLLLGRERSRDLRLLSAAWKPSEEYTASVAAQHQRIGEILRSVEIIQPKKVTLVSSGSNIPMFVRNDLPFDVTVEIFATPDDVRVKVQERTEVIAPANSTTRTAIPVTAGISNGDVRISLALRSPTGEIIDATKYADVSVRAEWEGIGLGILAALVALLLGLGTFRTIRRRRKNAANGVTEEKRPSKREARAAFRAAQDAETDEDSSSEGAPASEEDLRG